MRMEKAKNTYFVASSVKVPVGDNLPSFYQRPCNVLKSFLGFSIYSIKSYIPK